MDYIAFEEPEDELNLKELMWDLLEQWKAILIVAVVAAIVVSGGKYLKDKMDYNKTVKAAQQSTTTDDTPADQRIQQALDALPAADKPAVQTLARQQKQANDLNDYLESSLWLNANLTNERYLMAQYLMRSADDVNAQSLAYAYGAQLADATAIATFSDALGLNANSALIAELIKVSYSASATETRELTYSVLVVLPEGTSSQAAQEAVQSAMDRTRERLVPAFGEHSITFVSSQENYRYDREGVDLQNTLNANLTNIQNTIKTNTATLNSGQKAALASITSYLAADKTAAGEDTKNAQSTATANVQKPSFSKKFLLVGFAAGVFGYAIVYVIAAVIRSRVTSADQLAGLALCRLLGDVYFPVAHKGIGALFHSKAVRRHRCRNKGEVSTQIERAAATVASVCEHAKTSSITLLVLPSLTEKTGHVTSNLVEVIQEKGIRTNVVHITEETDEEVYLPIRNTVLIADQSCKTSLVWNTVQLCASYDIERLGCVYLKAC